MKKIRDLRRKLDLTQKEFAKELGVTRGVIAQIEQGNNKPTLALSEKIKSVFNIDIHSKETQFVYPNNTEKMNFLTFMLEDGIKTLSLLISIKKRYKYEFSEKEKKELKFYYDLYDECLDIKHGSSYCTEEMYSSLSLYIKVHLFRELGYQMHDVEKLLDVSTDYRFDKLFKE